ncbi:hypothetical protein T09_11918 [Trichinella sp. T9]|nr:hypothetical protein T09_11918 [Trichinella sp. T9]KRZ85862.1 hypothetical protein T08_11845 [Trichinella sp. T8]
MYLQVRLRVEERDACRFLWSNCSQHTPARVYRLTRVFCVGVFSIPHNKCYQCTRETKSRGMR